jgi:ribonuclease HI
MTDVAAAFPSTSKQRVVKMLIDNKAHPTVIRWVNNWLTDRAIETWIDGKPVERSAVNCGVPQGSPCSPVLFALTLANAVRELPDGISYVDDCSWIISFTKQRDFQEQATTLLDQVNSTLAEHGFKMDEAKTEVAWIFAGERPRAASKEKAKKWKLRWSGVTRKFNINAKPVRWLGFFLDCRMNWQAHVKHRLALGHYRLRTIARVMNAHGVPRKLARKIAWSVAMSTAAYGIEAIWEDQQWLLDGFHKLTVAIARTVAGTFGTTKGEDAIRAGDIPPTKPALDRRREKFLIATMAAPSHSPRRRLLPTSPEDDSSRHRISKWFRAAADRLIKEGQPVERSTPCYRRATPWATPVNPTLTYHAWTDGSFRKSAGLGWIITEDDMGRGPVIAQGSKTLGDKQTAFDAELTAVEAALLWYHDTDHPHLIIHSDSQSAIARSKHCGAGPGQRMAKSIQKILVDILQQGRTANIVWVKGHIGIPGNEKADRLAGQAAGKVAWSRTASISHLKLRISERFNKAKEEWHKNPKHHGKDEIPPPAPKKSCMDGARNSIARAATQIRTGHWRSATYLKRIKKQVNDNCWFCAGGATMTRSHVLLHCPSARMSAARMEAWEGRDPGGIRTLLANPRWEKRLLRFLELSGAGRIVASGEDEEEAWARRMDEWIVWEDGM